jgi:hypothetical protein
MDKMKIVYQYLNQKGGLKMKSKLAICIASLAMLTILSGCKADKVEVVVYTSDIQKASIDGVIEIPLTATFSLMGEDEAGNLPKASAVAKRYLDEKSEFKISKGDWGDVLVVKCSVPMGTTNALKTYLTSKHRPFALTITDSTVKLEPTQHLKNLNQDLGGINMMLDVEMPASRTIFRFIGDMAEAPEVKAFAVFVDKKPELVFQKKIERRDSVDVNFKGGVYSEINPQFNVYF